MGSLFLAGASKYTCAYIPGNSLWFSLGTCISTCKVRRGGIKTAGNVGDECL